MDGTISSYDADTRYTISWAFDFTSICASEQREVRGGQCCPLVLPKIKTMVNNEVKTMGAKRKRGRAGQRVTHVNGFHPHISPHYYDGDESLQLSVTLGTPSTPTVLHHPEQHGLPTATSRTYVAHLP
jgi:hypothetical protein